MELSLEQLDSLDFIGFGSIALQEEDGPEHPQFPGLPYPESLA